MKWAPAETPAVDLGSLFSLDPLFGRQNTVNRLTRNVSFWKFRVDLPCGFRDMSSPLYADRVAKKSKWLKITEILFGNKDGRYGEHNEFIVLFTLRLNIITNQHYNYFTIYILLNICNKTLVLQL